MVRNKEATKERRKWVSEEVRLRLRLQLNLLLVMSFLFMFICFRVRQYFWFSIEDRTDSTMLTLCWESVEKQDQQVLVCGAFTLQMSDMFGLFNTDLYFLSCSS